MLVDASVMMTNLAYVTASNISGDTAIDGENLERQAFSLNLDQKSEKSTSNLLIAYDHTDHKGGMGAFSFGKGVIFT